MDFLFFGETSVLLDCLAKNGRNSMMVWLYFILKGEDLKLKISASTVSFANGQL